MTIQTDLKAQIDRYNRVLAEATKECQPCSGIGLRDRVCDCGAQEDTHLGTCPDCNRSGRVARFREFRQDCHYDHHPISAERRKALEGTADESVYHPHCPPRTCNGLGWRVRAGDSADALSGLDTTEDASEVLRRLGDWMNWTDTHRRGVEDVRVVVPECGEIRAKELKLVCEVAGLTVLEPCA